MHIFNYYLYYFYEFFHFCKISIMIFVIILFIIYIISHQEKVKVVEKEKKAGGNGRILQIQYTVQI